MQYLPFVVLAGTPVSALSRIKAIKTMPLIPQHAHMRRLLKERNKDGSHYNLRRDLSAQQVDAAYQGYGVHYVDMWTGTPPQRQTLILGTASPGIGFPCSNCIDCGDEIYHVDRRFNETMSLTFQPVYCGHCQVGHCNVDTNTNGKCEMGFSYMEGSSWSGWEAKDMAYMGGPHDKALAKGEGDGEIHDDIDPDQAREYQFELDFVCQTELTGLFKTQLADGILGMDNTENSYWHQAMRANISDESAFSLCYARQPTASRKGTEAGAFTLGGFDKRLHNENSPVVYTPLDKLSRDYRVDVKAIYMRKGGGGDSALSNVASLPITSLELSEEELHRGVVVIDSGTTDTYLPRKFAHDFERVWKEMTDVPYHHHPLDLSEEELDGLPTILFQMKGDYRENQKIVSSAPYPLGTLGSAIPDENRTMEENFDVVVAVPPSHYMEYKEGRYTNRLYDDDGFGSTLGSNFIMGHDVTFDVENGRIGWAESECDYLALLDEFGEPNPWERPGEDDGGKGRGTGASDSEDEVKSPPVNNPGAPTNDKSEENNDEITQEQSKAPESSGSFGGILATVTLVVSLGVVGGVYGKQYYNRRRVGSNQYQVASRELELQAATDPVDTFSAPSTTIT